jgi:hypothetical protein
MINDTQITANFIVARIREPLQSRPYKNRPNFELSINMKTAKMLGLDVPWQLQQLADAVNRVGFFLHCMSLALGHIADQTLSGGLSAAGES